MSVCPQDEINSVPLHKTLHVFYITCMQTYTELCLVHHSTLFSSTKPCQEIYLNVFDDYYFGQDPLSWVCRTQQLSNCPNFCHNT